MFLKEFYRRMEEAGDDGGGEGTGGGASDVASFDGGDGSGADGSGDAGAGADAGASGVGTGGNASEGVVFPENWKAGLAEDLRDEPVLGNVPDIPTLVKNYVHAQKQMGKKGVPLPDQHSTSEDKKHFFQQLGLPSSSDEYEVSLPKDAEFDDGFISAFKQKAYEANILPEQANDLLAWYHEANSESMNRILTQNETEMQAELEQLKREWGNDYNTKKMLANRVLREIDDDQIHGWIKDTGLENSAPMIKLMAKMGEMMREDRVIDFGDNVGPTGKEIQKRISELESNRSGPLYDRKHPNHDAAVQERNKLYGQLYPDG